MALNFCVLGSGSSGNSVAFWDAESFFLVDAGFSCKETARRLGLAGLDAANLDEILISHEHSDHINGSRVINKKFSTKLHTTFIVSKWMDAKFGMATEPDLEPDTIHELGNFRITPFEVCHDASQTVGFTIENNGSKVAIATDLGHITPKLAKYFTGADAIIIESNHDVQMLKDGSYPYFLKQRILGKQGHLSNVQSSEMLLKVLSERTKHVTLAHISRENNTPEIALEESRNMLGKKIAKGIDIVPASQFDIGNIIKIR